MKLEEFIKIISPTIAKLEERDISYRVKSELNDLSTWLLEVTFDDEEDDYNYVFTLNSKNKLEYIYGRGLPPVLSSIIYGNLDSAINNFSEFVNKNNIAVIIKIDNVTTTETQIIIENVFKQQFTILFNYIDKLYISLVKIYNPMDFTVDIFTLNLIYDYIYKEKYNDK